jgi:hypothetical protein
MTRNDGQLGPHRFSDAPVIGGALLGGGFALFVYMAGLPGVPHSLLTIPVGVAFGYFVGRAIRFAVIEGSGRAAQSINMPVAAGTYTFTHSHIDAMEAKGDHEGAARAWDLVALEHPGDPWPLIRAGEIYMRSLGAPEQALGRFARARDLPGIKPEQQRYASQKVIDVYLGPLHAEGRAMVELRRLIEQHPGTREAEGARLALQRLKAT